MSEMTASLRSSAPAACRWMPSSVLISADEPCTSLNAVYVPPRTSESWDRREELRADVALDLGLVEVVEVLHLGVQLRARHRGHPDPQDPRSASRSPLR